MKIFKRLGASAVCALFKSAATAVCALFKSAATAVCPLFKSAATAVCPLFKSGHNSFLNKYKKNGAPNIAIKIPTGNSVGAKIIRAKVSLIETTAAPRNAAPGNKIR